MSILRTFFGVEHAFTLEGIAKFGGQLLSLAGIAFAFRLVMRTPKAQVSVVQPLGLFDVDQYKESFSLRGIPMEKEIREALSRTIGPAASQNPGMHLVATWDASAIGDVVPPPVTVRGEVMEFPVSPAARIAYAKRLLETENLASYPPPRSPREILFRQPTPLWEILKPSDPRSRYAKAEAWPSTQIFALPNVQQDLTRNIETSGAGEQVQANAIEQIYGARTFLNWIEVRNASSHAVISTARVAIDHLGKGDCEIMPLGSFSELGGKAGALSATLRNLLPGEKRWALIRSRSPIRRNEVTVLADPTSFFHPGYTRAIMVGAALVTALWVIGNLV